MHLWERVRASPRGLRISGVHTYRCKFWVVKAVPLSGGGVWDAAMAHGDGQRSGHRSVCVFCMAVDRHSPQDGTGRDSLRVRSTSSNVLVWKIDNQTRPSGWLQSKLAPFPFPFPFSAFSLRSKSKSIVDNASPCFLWMVQGTPGGQMLHCDCLYLASAPPSAQKV
jgi:hypothetical protein